jgi:hypothetical protein
VEHVRTAEATLGDVSAIKLAGPQPGIPPLSGSETVEIVQVVSDTEGLARDIVIHPAGSKLTDSQQRLLIDAARALTVVSVVMARTERLSFRLRWSRNAGDVPKLEPPPDHPRRKRDHYVRRLALIASAGLREEDVPYARLALEAFKEEFVAMEADMVKNQYLRSLGLRALIGALVFGIGWGACYTTYVAKSDVLKSVAPNLEPFLLTAVGACVGTWLSFAIRRVVLGFNDLAALEDDRMAPTSRILFVVGLTWVVGLFLQSGVIIAVVNNVSLNLSTSPFVTLLIGILCGISERALAGAVSRRSIPTTAYCFSTVVSLPPS